MYKTPFTTNYYFTVTGDVTCLYTVSLIIDFSCVLSMQDLALSRAKVEETKHELVTTSSFPLVSLVLLSFCPRNTSHNKEPHKTRKLRAVDNILHLQICIRPNSPMHKIVCTYCVTPPPPCGTSYVHRHSLGFLVHAMARVKYMKSVSWKRFRT